LSDLNLDPPPSRLRAGLSYLSKPWVLIVLGVLVAGAVGVFSLNTIMTSILHSRPEVIVPNLEGKSLSHALNLVSSLNLSLKEEGAEFDEGLPAGTILRQQPPPGMHVRTERTITVTVSKGGQSLFVPNVAGKKLVEAQSILAGEGLQMGAVNEVFSTSQEAESVVSQNPSSGTIVARGALVDVDVSKGLPPAGSPIVPDLVGQNLDNAQQWAKDVNVKVKVKEDAKAAGAAGSIVRQKPAPGQPLLDGDELMVTVVPLAGGAQGARVRAKIPLGAGGRVHLKIIARNNRGENEIYSGEHKGGDVVDVPVNVNSTTRFRIYIDDVLQEEQVLEP
jgi:serine/threonine-protein kinase